MMCEECGIRPAKFHLTTISGDQKKERNLCPVCMAKYQKQIPGLDITNLAGIISGFLEAAGAKGKSGQEPDEADQLACPVCGTTYATFKKTSMLGCADCYRAFQKPLEALLLRVHGNTQHAGKIPGTAKNDVSIRMNISRLKQELQKAIADEEYEEAARLRDQIRSLSQQMEMQAEAAVSEGEADISEAAAGEKPESPEGKEAASDD